MAYSQNFTSLDGTTYTIEVNGVTLPTGATVPPLGNDPFTTEEDADTDMFMPVRTQSGYIRMQSMDKTTWRSFIPSGAVAEPVTLKQGTTILWQGYVQTGTYGMAYPATYDDIDIPVICGLGALDAFDVEVQGPADMVTVGQLLYYIFSKLTGLTYTYYFHASSSTDADIKAWLGYKLSWRNFLSANGNELTSRFSCLGLLQELCKFFGWSCRTFANGVYFSSITDTLHNQRWLCCPLAQLNVTTPTLNAVGMNSLTLTDAMFASTDHSEEFIPGCKKVTVSPELNAYDVIMEIPYDEIFRPYKYDTPTTALRWRNSINDVVDIWLLHRSAINYENAQVAITSYIETAEGYGDPPMCYGRFIAFDDDMEDDKKKFSWTKCYECFISDDYGNRRSTTPLFTMESKGAVIIGDGVLFISGRSDGQSTSPLAQRDGCPVCTLKIGDLYWNGSAWTTTESRFTLEMKQNGVADTDTIFNNAEYDGAGFPVTTPITGKIYFAVHDVTRNLNWYNGYFPLMDFKIGFVRNGEEDELNDKEYTANGGSFPEDVNIDTIFSTDKTNITNSKTFRCQAGYGLIYNGNVVADTIPYGTTQLKPEQHTADLVAAYGSTIRRSLSIDLWTSQIGNAGPSCRLTLEGATFYPIAVSRNWRNNVTTLKIMEI